MGNKRLIKEVNIIKINIKNINPRTFNKHKTYKSNTPDINQIISLIDQQEDIVAWQTKRKINISQEHRLINNKLYDLKKKKFLKTTTPPTKEDIETLKSFIKQRRIDKNNHKPQRQLSEITDHEYYRPIIINFLKDHKGKAYTFDTIAKNVNYKIIDYDDKKYFISIIETFKKVSSKQYEGMTYYYI